MDRALNLAGDSKVVDAQGSLLDVLLLQLHLVAATVWLLSCALLAAVAVPGMRKLWSDAAMAALWSRRAALAGLVWTAFTLTLLSGTYLLVNQAAYSAPWSSSDWRTLADEPYAVPYFYALYAKLALFLVMGLASLILTRQLQDEPRDDTGHCDQPLDLGTVEVGGAIAAPAPVALRAVLLSPRTEPALLWGSVGVLLVGAGGVGLCVTLIKYFHELSRAAIAYHQLRSR